MFMILMSFVALTLIQRKISLKFTQTFYWIMLCFILGLLYEFQEIVNMGTKLGGDSMSLVLSLLSVWLGGLMLMSSNFNKNKKEFKLLINLMMLMLLVSFLSLDLLLFYISFEMILIPMFFLILGFGSQPERLEGGIYMLFYTMFGSLPLLMMLMFYKNQYETFSYSWNLVSCEKFVFFPVLYLLAFLVKLPMYFFHLWLPKTHVEAPVSGSSLLAAVLLKLGGYGIMRFIPFMNLNLLEKSILFGISFWGSVLGAFSCLCQLDMKKFIAYSSISHSGFMLSSCLTEMWWSKIGMLMMSSGHGLCSSASFCLVNFLYERSFTRSILLSKGILLIFPSLSLWWFVTNLINSGTPPFLNLISEIFLMMSTLIWWPKGSMLIVSMIFFLSVSYSMYFYSSICHGKSLKILNFNVIKVREFLLLKLHLTPLLILILKTDIFLI